MKCNFNRPSLVHCLGAGLLLLILPTLSLGQGPPAGVGPPDDARPPGGPEQPGKRPQYEIRSLEYDPMCMGDAFGTLTFQIRTTRGDDIYRLRFTLPSAYSALSGQGPPGWSLIVGPANVLEFSADVSETDNHLSNSNTAFVLKIGGAKNGPLPNGPENLSATLANLQAWTAGEVESELKKTNQFLDFPWLLHSLNVKLFVDPFSMALKDQAEFSLLVTNRTTREQTVGGTTPKKINGSGQGNMKLVSGPSPTRLTLPSGGMKAMTWSFEASNTGNVMFESSAAVNKQITSPTVPSPEVLIGDLGGYLDVPLTAANNQEITIAFHVINNSDAALTNLIPRALTWKKKGDLDNPRHVSGPIPAGPMPSLDPGAATVFYYVYRLSGSPGAQYLFTAMVDCDQLKKATKDQSQWGTLETFAASVTPATVGVGESSVSFTFDIVNGGTAKDSVDRVTLLHPDAYFAMTPQHFISRSPSGGNKTAWKVSGTTAGHGGVIFTAPDGDALMGGQSMTLEIAYNIPGVPYYPDETPLKFLATLEGQVDGTALAESRLLPFSVTHRVLELEVIPVPPQVQPLWVADGTTTRTIRARLLQGKDPLSEKNVNFSVTLMDPGANVVIPPVVSPSFAKTDKAGFATVSLKHPRYEEENPATLDIRVRAWYQDLESHYPVISFNRYLPVTFDLLQLEARQGGKAWALIENWFFMPGDSKPIELRPRIDVIGSSSVNIRKSTVNGDTVIRFTDAENDGGSVYTAPLSQDYLNVTGPGSVTLLFNPVSVPAGFLYGHYAAEIVLNYTNNVGQVMPPFTVKSTKAKDKIRIGAMNQGIQIINWRERLQKIE